MSAGDIPMTPAPEPDPADALFRTLGDAAGAVTRVGQDAALTLTRATYTSAYFMAYAAVFTAVLVGRALPRQNPVMQGFGDGGRAARDALADLKAQGAAR